MTDADGADAPAEQPSSGWLLLVYRIPSEPTRLRAAVWRRLKGLGAIYLQNSVAALPAAPAAERALRLLRREILDGLRKEYREDHFTYAELEENDEDLIKLRNWFAKIEQRDVFGAPGRQACREALQACERALEAYAAWVYATESDGA